MAGIKLEHFNVMTARLDETIKFYTEVLELHEGFYPSELGPGTWLYDSTGTAIIHTQVFDPDDFPAHAAKVAARLGDLRPPMGPEMPRDTGAIDHIAFSCQDIDAFRARLRRLGVPFRETGLASATLRQIFVRDPNGVILELNFRG